MIKQTTFKAGDLVYYPNRGTKIYELQESNSLDFLLEIKNSSTWTLFRSNGKANSLKDITQIFHATEDNCYLLSKLYGIEFEKPRTRQVVEHLLRTHEYVACYTSDSNETPSPDDVKKFITHIHNGATLPFVDAELDEWRYAIPFDIKTGEVITEIEE
ncbi:hypothetical protein [Moraxella phage Mcat24]|uniref:hypothetical protein n=1 Tax=Moraxella catarrhalis TaxID=480 RepID=UPI000202ABD9|nr:hypothetical protein [Moraxella catarrhalis]AKI28066.1 hypothetical protein [Moraxella phage Mcat24]AKI28222.1 hypothetical protein [Moraxella phage Mcat27]EGE25893.1 hypothetical protein E9W_03380 [Moraxella catarrhalis CO72]MPX08604.1 hypothetical protein [Moraxella catarrhalis]MPX08882.1 hypothetical protein [Moraxella catarrhalis]